MKHILTILVMMMALGCYASEPFTQDTIPSQQMADTTQHARKSWMTRFLDYFNDANKTRSISGLTSVSSEVLIMLLIRSLA